MNWYEILFLLVMGVIYARVGIDIARAIVSADDSPLGRNLMYMTVTLAWPLLFVLASFCMAFKRIRSRL